MHELLSQRQLPTTQRNHFDWFPLKILRSRSALQDQPYGVLRLVFRLLALRKERSECSRYRKFVCALFLVWNCTLAQKHLFEFNFSSTALVD